MERDSLGDMSRAAMISRLSSHGIAWNKVL
jgi:hypothetical protein